MRKIRYEKLNARQKEIFNFQKVSAVFADFGFTTLKLSDDWMGADFIAISFDGKKSLKVQLKSRLTFDKKYIGKDLYVCFFDRISGKWYLYSHDSILKSFLVKIESSDSWVSGGKYHFSVLSRYAKGILSHCVLG